MGSRLKSKGIALLARLVGCEGVSPVSKAVFTGKWAVNGSWPIGDDGRPTGCAPPLVTGWGRDLVGLGIDPPFQDGWKDILLQKVKAGEHKAFPTKETWNPADDHEGGEDVEDHDLERARAQQGLGPRKRRGSGAVPLEKEGPRARWGCSSEGCEHCRKGKRTTFKTKRVHGSRAHDGLLRCFNDQDAWKMVRESRNGKACPRCAVELCSSPMCSHHLRNQMQIGPGDDAHTACETVKSAAIGSGFVDYERRARSSQVDTDLPENLFQ